MANVIRLLRILDVLARVGVKHAFLYNQIRDGLFVKPVKITARASAWPSNEVDALVAAKIRGATDAQLKTLVRELEAARKTAGVEAA
jgi:prophage regulatory protein